MVTREQIIELLEHIATLLELKGENPFKIRAYRNGADIARSYGGDFIQEARDEKIHKIKGIGDALAQKLNEFATTGKLEYYENLKREFPETIFELFEVQGLGPKKIKALHAQLGVSSLADLKRVCESGEASQLSGFGKKTAEKILEALAFKEQHADRFRLGDVSEMVRVILETLKAHPAAGRVEPAGSVRRGKETVHDIDFIVETKDPEAIKEHFVSQEWVDTVQVDGSTKVSVIVTGGIQCDVRMVGSDAYPFALNYFTGSKEHNVVMRGRARDRGWTLNEYRLAPLDANSPEPPAVHEEADLYKALDLPYIDPALRENTGEFDTNRLPRLIELESLRGTFHNHTVASDGKNTLREMAEAARELGLQYLGIADHSKSSFQANGLDEQQLRTQIAEIRELNKQWDDFKLFAGTECDIMKDGSLDFDDDLLAECDYVVAAVHNAMTLPEEEQTARIISAMENPHVTMLAHPTGRLLLKREAYAVHIPSIIDAAARTNTIIEINANPWRLDMDWRWWKLAKEKGVKCSINPDAHSTRGLQDLYYGVLQARKGWLTKDDVINCLPLGEIERVL